MVTMGKHSEKRISHPSQCWFPFHGFVHANNAHCFRNKNPKAAWKPEKRKEAKKVTAHTNKQRSFSGDDIEGEDLSGRRRVSFVLFGAMGHHSRLPPRPYHHHHYPFSNYPLVVYSTEVLSLPACLSVPGLDYVNIAQGTSGLISGRPVGHNGQRIGRALRAVWTDLKRHWSLWKHPCGPNIPRRTETAGSERCRKGQSKEKERRTNKK